MIPCHPLGRVLRANLTHFVDSISCKKHIFTYFLTSALVQVALGHGQNLEVVVNIRIFHVFSSETIFFSVAELNVL